MFPSIDTASYLMTVCGDVFPQPLQGDGIQGLFASFKKYIIIIVLLF